MMKMSHTFIHSNHQKVKFSLQHLRILDSWAFWKRRRIFKLTILGDFGTFMKWFISWPLLFLMFITIPNCNNPKFEKFFIVTFVMSTVWIAAFSYVMVWMVCMIGFTLGIPDTIMGITFLAAGTSVPDTIASVMVARNGYGDMAVSNSIGSNVFDILLGLGLPWFLSTTIRPNGGEPTVSKNEFKMTILTIYFMIQMLTQIII